MLYLATTLLNFHAVEGLLKHSVILYNLNKGGKFLKKLWCCVSGGNKVIWLYQLS